MIQLLLLAAGGLFLYTQTKKNTPAVLNPTASASQQPQPAQKYPFVLPANPNQANANQPWAAALRPINSITSRLPGGPVAGSQSDIGTGLSVASQATSLWNDLDFGSYFSSGADADSMQVADDDVESYPEVDYGDYGNSYDEEYS